MQKAVGNPLHRIILVSVFLGTLLLLAAACELPTGLEKSVEKGEETSAVEEPQQGVDIVESSAPGEAEPAQECTYTAECSGEKKCINGLCQLLTDIYSDECEQRCSIKEVAVSTSDGDSATYAPGQGSYTAAGGLDWDVLRVPEHCPAEAPVVAFQLTYKTTGKVLGENIITVAEGQESEVITHPALSSVKFRLKVEGVEIEC